VEREHSVNRNGMVARGFGAADTGKVYGEVMNLQRIGQIGYTTTKK
jgi:hypothetical protein